MVIKPKHIHPYLFYLISAMIPHLDHNQLNQYYYEKNNLWSFISGPGRNRFM